MLPPTYLGPTQALPGVPIVSFVPKKSRSDSQSLVAFPCDMSVLSFGLEQFSNLSFMFMTLALSDITHQLFVESPQFGFV